MATLSYTGLHEPLTAFRTTVQLPAQGAWRICLELPEEVANLTQVQVTFRDILFSGKVVASERQSRTYHVDIRPGKGLQSIAQARSYSSGAVATMIRDAVSDCGETLSVQSVLSTKIKDWFRFPGQTLPQILGQLGVKWHCLASGEVVVGEVWPEDDTGESYYLSSHPQAGIQQLMLEPETFIWPSVTVKAVEYTASAENSAHCVVQM